MKLILHLKTDFQKKIECFFNNIEFNDSNQIKRLIRNFVETIVNSHLDRVISFIQLCYPCQVEV